MSVTGSLALERELAQLRLERIHSPDPAWDAQIAVVQRDLARLRRELTAAREK